MKAFPFGFEIAAAIVVIVVLFFVVIPRLLMPGRAWWYLRVARGSTPPPEVRRYLMKRGMEQLRNADLPPEIQRTLAIEQLAAVLDDKDHVFDEVLGDVVGDAMGRLAKTAISAERDKIEQRRREIISEGAAAGKTISTEAALKYVLAHKSTYDGPDREEYIREIDRFADEFRKKHGSQIPVDEAYAVLRELEEKYGPVEG